MTVALACAEGDWPHDEWPGPDDPFVARLVPPPYDGLRTDVYDAPDVVVLRCDDPAHAFPRLQSVMGEKTAPVVVVSPAWDAEQVVGLLRRGVAGYLVDGDYCPCMLTAAVLGTASGQTHLSPMACATLREGAQHMASGNGGAMQRLRAGLSPRERQIMELLSSGFGAPQIGQRLNLSEKTVRNNLSNVYAKLDARGSTDAVLLWLGAMPHENGPRVERGGLQRPGPEVLGNY
ncbi:LuxR C-terminal-related transcriptional regulator [Streptomyces sp. NPDC052236]|uniref:helix-turn-helix transcriptional regulator n=1 Tax=Streptomyces sp. NPDC052236 TaxID=3365686 RepID=UPI0037D7ABF5